MAASKPTTVDNSVPAVHDAIMDQSLYLSLCAVLEKVHPEDLVNIMTRVLMDHSCIELIGHGVNHSLESEVMIGQIVVPAQGPKERDRLFTITIDEVVL